MDARIPRQGFEKEKSLSVIVFRTVIGGQWLGVGSGAL